MVCGIYKYVWHNEVVYIGKADKDIMSRISAHKVESKFQPYLKDCVISYTECVNPAHTTILETFLINKYKPRLNVSMKYGESLPISIVEPEWKPISNLICKDKKQPKKKKQPKIWGDIWVQNRRKDIKELKQKITALRWTMDILSSHFGEYGFEISIPEWVYELHCFPAIDTSQSLYDNGIYIALIRQITSNEEKHEYSAQFLDERYIKARTDDIDDFDFWRDYKLLILQTINKHKIQIKEIEEKILTNERLRHES